MFDPTLDAPDEPVHLWFGTLDGDACTLVNDDGTLDDQLTANGACSLYGATGNFSLTASSLAGDSATSPSVVVWALHNTSLGVAQSTLFNYTTVFGSYVLQITPTAPPLAAAPSSSWGYLTLSFPGCAAPMTFVGPRGMPHGVQSVSGSGWVSETAPSAMALPRVMYALVFDSLNGPRVFVNGVEYSRPELAATASLACRFGIGNTWTNRPGTLTFSTFRSRIVLQQYEVYDLPLAVSDIGAMFANQAVTAPPPVAGTVSAGPFTDCSAADADEAFMTHRYLGDSPVSGTANNEVVDRVGSQNGVISENFAATAPTATTPNATFLPPGLTFIPALFSNGTLSFGQIEVDPYSSGVTVRLLCAWGAASGTLTMQFGGYTVSISPTNVTITNPLSGPAFSTYSLSLPGAGFNNQYIAFVASSSSAAVFVGV